MNHKHPYQPVIARTRSYAHTYRETIGTTLVVSYMHLASLAHAHTHGLGYFLSHTWWVKVLAGVLMIMAVSYILTDDVWTNDEDPPD